MNLYKISQSVNNDWGTYDSAIVAAPDADKARVMHPNGHKTDRLDRRTHNFSMGGWVVYASDVKVELIGVAHSAQLYALHLMQGKEQGE